MGLFSLYLPQGTSITVCLFKGFTIILWSFFNSVFAFFDFVFKPQLKFVQTAEQKMYPRTGKIKVHSNFLQMSPQLYRNFKITENYKLAINYLK